MAKSICLIGCGNWGQYILRDLLTLNCEVTVLVHSAESQDRAKKLGATRFINTLSELKTVDGFVVAVPTIQHFAVLQEIIQRFPKVPIFCEKALTCSVADAQKLYQLAGDDIFVMDKWRYHPGILKLADINKSGKYGALQGIKTIRVAPGSLHKDLDPVWILLSHDISIIYEITGKFPSFTAALSDRNGPYINSLRAIATLQPWLDVEVSGRSVKRERRVDLYYRDYVLSLDDAYANAIKVFSWEQSTYKMALIEELPLSKELPLLLELQAFLNFLQGGPKPKSTCLEGLKAVEIIAAARELSQKNGL